MVSLGMIAAWRGPWLTGGTDVQPAVVVLISVVLPITALVIGVSALQLARSQSAAVSPGETALAWLAIGVPAAWMSFRLLFLAGELIRWHD